MKASSKIIDPTLLTLLMGGRIKQVLIMEPCLMTRAGICSLVTQPDFQVGRCLESVRVIDLPEIMSRHQPDLVLMELRGDGESVLDGLQMVSQLLKTWPLVPLIICTVLDDYRLLRQLAAMGVSGIYLKQESLLELARCVLHVMANKTIYSSQTTTLIGAYRSQYPMLTHNEIGVLEYLWAGQSVTTTARMLHRDIRTVSSHKRNAMSKLGFHNDSEFYAWGAWLSSRNTASGKGER